MVKHAVHLCIALLVWLAGLDLVRAQAQNDDAARTLFVEGIAHTQHKRWEEAERAFRASLAQVERASTLYNLAITLLHRDRPSEALLRLDQFEKLAEPLNSARELASLPRLRARAAALVSNLVLHVAPDAAELWLDGAPSPEQGAERSLQLDPGEHVLRLQHPGHEDASLALTLSPGERSEHNLTLKALPLPKLASSAAAEATGPALERTPAPAPRRPDQHRASPAWVSKWWVWTTAALVVGAAVTSGVLLAQRDRDPAPKPEGTPLPEWVVSGTGR